MRHLSYLTGQGGPHGCLHPRVEDQESGEAGDRVAGEVMIGWTQTNKDCRKRTEFRPLHR